MEFITKETALLAKEKGFKITRHTSIYELAELLRKRNGIFIEIEIGTTMAAQSMVSYSYKIYRNSNGINFETIIPSESNYLDYSECLETALQEALKMIEL